MAVSEAVRLATVEEHVRAENARDVDAVMDTFTASDDARLVYNGIPTQGHRKIRRSYELGITSLPDFRFEVVQRHFTPDSLIAEHMLHFTNQKGQAVAVPMCVIYCFDEAGKLSEERIFFNETQVAF